ncbi:MAG: hypothetical protein AAGF84_12155 [Planctomycetota bacterium]
MPPTVSASDSSNAAATQRPGKIYQGDADALVVESSTPEKLVLVPEGQNADKPDTTRRLRIMWGQHLLDDLLAGRYRSLVCAVNTDDNAHGILGQLASLLPSSQWTADSITRYAAQFAGRSQTTVLKYDFDAVEALALLRPADTPAITLDHLAEGFRLVNQMLSRRSERLPVASVSFLGARANRLAASVERPDVEPAFETVLSTMHDTGFAGDVYPAVWMWDSAPTALFARYPFPQSIEQMRGGGS